MNRTPILSPPKLLNAERWRDMRIGLLGGSFNPPHKGHVHISLEALVSLQLDAVWWLVTPQNPIKADKPLSLDKRMQLCREINSHPRILISDIERDLNTSITFFTVRKLKTHFPKTKFVWITGMDNALIMHKWNYWRPLLKEVPTAHITRMPAETLVQSCPLRGLERQKHIHVDKGGRFSLAPGRTYWLMQKKMVNISSTSLREII